MPSTTEIDVKLAFARQAGDEAGHFQLVADRLSALGFDVAAFRPPGESPLFQYLKGLSTTVERVAAGLFTLESIAYAVNENFMTFCDRRGDGETVRIYREYIQPDERAHQQLGQRLLAKYATTPELQRAAWNAVARVLEIAAAARTQAARADGHRQLSRVLNRGPMSGKLVPKVILEGTRLTHKTDLAFALNEHPRVVGPRKYRYHSPLVSAEWCAFTNFPWGRGLINFDGPGEEALALETYATWARLFELQRFYSWIVDRFHVSTQVWQRRERRRELDFRLARGAAAAARVPHRALHPDTGLVRRRARGAPHRLRQPASVRRSLGLRPGAGRLPRGGAPLDPARARARRVRW